MGKPIDNNLKERLMKRSMGFAFLMAFVLATAGCPSPGGGGNGTPANTDLSSLQLQGGTLTKAFAPAVTRYETVVDISQTSITVNAAAADSNATVSYEPSQTVALASNATTVKIVVRHSNGEFKVYKVIAFKPDFVSPNLGNMVNIPAGFFYRSAAKTYTASVSKSYRICQHEVTRAEWVNIMGAGNDPTNTAYSSGSMNDPVIEVNFYRIVAFCNKLSLAEGLTPVYSVASIDFSTLAYADIPTDSNAAWEATTADWNANGYRLPTMVEWQWAAMGTDPNGVDKAFAGSDGTNVPGDYAVFGYSHNTPGATTTNRTNPTCGKFANEIGLYDMSGNAIEWLWDLSGVVPTGNLNDFRGPATTTEFRKTAGGGYITSVNGINVTFTGWMQSFDGGSATGFRVVRNN